MFINTNAKSTVVVALLLAAVGGTAGLAIAGSSKGPLRCELRVTKSGGNITLEALAFSDKSIEGTYRLMVDRSGQGGNSVIQQGGPFNVDAAKASSLGLVSLGTGSSYDARLEVKGGGTSVKCTETVGAGV
ncbi:curli-like amyloid fiber formation chaperone CsgH [Rhizobium sp. FKY42]|uniref:curli-like amyloid fiber formation chaperone CsgH n=1 Tax=Rhizobium sp. FKY42 TaxID=2562310 RepID=UPI0010BFFD44|nr:curli-like amyloid fiber formation chaperone CsgH [Rhizobium sp. FKY42]